MTEPNIPGNTATPPGDVVAVPIWLRPWFQFLMGATAVFVFLAFVIPPVAGLVYALRSILTPVVFALTLAYIFNPLVDWMERRLQIPRWGGTGLIMATGALAVTLALLLGVPVLIQQGSSLFLKLEEVYPEVVDSLVAEVNERDVVSQITGVEQTDKTASPDAAQDEPDTKATADTDAEKDGEAQQEDIKKEEVTAFARMLQSNPVQALLQRTMDAVAGLEWGTVADTAFKTMDVGTNVVGSAISLTMYWLLFVMVALFSFFFLSWKLGEFMDWFIPFIPVQHRARTLQILKRMDRTVSAWLRGRLLQGFLLAVMLSTGWGIAGVPYWFLLGLLSGVLGLVPYLIVLGWGVALLLASLDAMAGGTFSWWVLFWPTLVYVLAQAIDGWVVEPLLQGKATEMSTLTVLLVVMAGGVLGGLIGLLVAIPVAACIKILCVELVLPKLRELAAGRSSLV